jgi:hypothetical protein
MASAAGNPRAIDVDDIYMPLCSPTSPPRHPIYVADFFLPDITRQFNHRSEEIGAEYPIGIKVISAAVVLSTMIAVIVGYLHPSPAAGIALAMTVTLWWCLYRVVARYDGGE